MEISEVLLGYFPDNHKGVLLEVGGGHPTEISISNSFRGLNWEIITIEPNPEFCQEYKKRNIGVLEYAACDEDKGIVPFKVSPNNVSCSALEIRYLVQQKGMGWTDEQFKTINVKALTLNTILNIHYPELKHIDILVVDTEGWELEVLDGLDFIKFRPDVMCIENFQNLASYGVYMRNKGYNLDRKEDQDEFYLKTIK